MKIRIEELQLLAKIVKNLNIDERAYKELQWHLTTPYSLWKFKQFQDKYIDKRNIPIFIIKGMCETGYNIEDVLDILNIEEVKKYGL